MNTIQEACAALVALYQSQGIYVTKIQGVQVGTAPVDSGGGPCLDIFVSHRYITFVPDQSKPGSGFDGFQCVAYNGPSTFISDSGVIS